MALDLPALGKIGGGPTVTCSMEKPVSALKLLGGSFKISSSPEVSGHLCFFCHLDFVSVSFSFHLKRPQLSEPQFPPLSIGTTASK